MKGPFFSKVHPDIYAISYMQFCQTEKALDRQCIERAVMNVATTIAAMVYVDTRV